MKTIKTCLVIAVAMLLVACNKNHYDLQNVQGVALEGEMLLPLANGKYTLSDMMERFEIDSMISFDASGNMFFHYDYEHNEAVSGTELLTFKDFEQEQTWMFDGAWMALLPAPVDTVVHIEQTVELESENIHVLSALVKSGDFHFSLANASEILEIRSIQVHIPEIKDDQGNEFWHQFSVGSDADSVSLNGFLYETAEANQMHIDLRVSLTVRPSNQTSGYFGYVVSFSGLNLSEMRGWVDPYSTFSRIETSFDIFPENVSGSLDLSDVRLSLKMRNSFHLPAHLSVDTAMVSGPGFEPVSVFEVMPQEVDIDYSPSFVEIFNRTMSGKVSANGAVATATSEFVLNPNGLTHPIEVCDTNSVAVRVDVEVPLAFTANEVAYIDTVNVNLNEIQSPEWIKVLTLRLDLTSTIPLNINGALYMYDSEQGRITDTLLSRTALIEASADGQPSRKSIDIAITKDRVEHVMQSDRMVLGFELDSDAQEACLKSDQFLEFFVKAKVEYDDDVEFKND